jgi:hypothetical protein
VCNDDEIEYLDMIKDGISHMQLPVFNPRLNIRHILLHLLLLQEHLEQPGMQCTECIVRKHMLTIEAYALEAIGLCKDGEMNIVLDMQNTIHMMRCMARRYIENSMLWKLPCARATRVLRKQLSKKYYITV